MKLIKGFFGLLSFSMVVAVSFLIINDVAKMPAFCMVLERCPQSGAIMQSTPVIPTAQADDEPAAQYAVTPTPQPDPQQAARPEPGARFSIHDAPYYMAYQGYPFTVKAEFGAQELHFHVAYDADIVYGMRTAANLVNMFDKFYEIFPQELYAGYFIVAGDGDMRAGRIYYNPDAGMSGSAAAYMFLGGGLPKWLCMGLEAYVLGCGYAEFLACEELRERLTPGANTLQFGDGWLAFTPQRANCVRDIAYSVVRRWSEAGNLYDFVRLAQADKRAFGAVGYSYIALLKNVPTPDMQFMYMQGDFKVITCLGGYIFIDDGYKWTWARVSSFVSYMDAAIKFVREHFHINDRGHVRVTLYPFGVNSIPASIAAMAYDFGWDALDVNFVANDEIVLASTARFATWAIAHEVTHIMLFRDFVGYNPPIWMVEGMAVLGEILFRDAFEGVRPYRFSVPTVANIHNLSRSGNGHSLPFRYYETRFGRDNWTYDDAGSFMLYLYNRFGMEALLQLYRADNASQFEMAYELFDKELEELIYSWRGFLWPNGERLGWW